MVSTYMEKSVGMFFWIWIWIWIFGANASVVFLNLFGSFWIFFECLQVLLWFCVVVLLSFLYCRCV